MQRGALAIDSDGLFDGPAGHRLRGEREETQNNDHGETGHFTPA
jgi:hypothetical protein